MFKSAAAIPLDVNSSILYTLCVTASVIISVSVTGAAYFDFAVVRAAGFLVTTAGYVWDYIYVYVSYDSLDDGSDGSE